MISMPPTILRLIRTEKGRIPHSELAKFVS